MRLLIIEFVWSEATGYPVGPKPLRSIRLRIYRDGWHAGPSRSHEMRRSISRAAPWPGPNCRRLPGSTHLRTRIQERK